MVKYKPYEEPVILQEDHLPQPLKMYDRILNRTSKTWLLKPRIHFEYKKVLRALPKSNLIKYAKWTQLRLQGHEDMPTRCMKR